MLMIIVCLCVVSERAVVVVVAIAVAVVFSLFVCFQIKMRSSDLVVSVVVRAIRGRHDNSDVVVVVVASFQFSLGS